MKYCGECGKKLTAGKKFCTSCGATVDGAKSASNPVIVPQPAQVAAIPQQAINPQPSGWGKIVRDTFALILFIIFIYAVVVMLSPDSTSANTDGTATTGGSSSTVSSGNGCSAGYCNSNGYCCPSNAKYYCGGSCYYTIDDAFSAGGCGSFQIKC
ncbi:MAG: zinc-ribbon domain-containing protein [archaeon]